MSGVGCPPYPGEPLLYVYAADGGDGHGVWGVTDVFGVAKSRLVDALTAMPYGAKGTIRRARLDIHASPSPSYRYGSVIVCGWRDARSGVLVVAGTLLDTELADGVANELPFGLSIFDVAPPEGRR